MRLFHNVERSLKTYFLTQAVLAGGLFGFVFGLGAGYGTEFGISAPVFNVLSVLVSVGYLAYLAFPSAATTYYIKTSPERWRRIIVFGLIGTAISIISLYQFFRSGGGVSMVKYPFSTHIVVAVALSSLSAVLIAPIAYSLGYFRDFSRVNFHLLLALAMLSVSIPTAFLGVSLAEVLVNVETSSFLELFVG